MRVGFAGGALTPALSPRERGSWCEALVRLALTPALPQGEGEKRYALFGGRVGILPSRSCRIQQNSIIRRARANKPGGLEGVSHSRARKDLVATAGFGMLQGLFSPAQHA